MKHETAYLAEASEWRRRARENLTISHVWRYLGDADTADCVIYRYRVCIGNCRRNLRWAREARQERQMWRPRAGVP